eukprot:SAG11_NODE_2328_length_3514_cov_3.922694_5_plen_288_part_00
MSQEAAARLAGQTKAVVRARFLAMDPQLQAHRAVALAAVQADGTLFAGLSPALWGDRELVDAAIHACPRFSGEAADAVLRHAAAELRADREFMVSAVQHNGWTLQYASAELRADREVAVAAVRQYDGAFKHVADELRTDKGFVLAVLALPNVKGDTSNEAKILGCVPSAALRSELAELLSSASDSAGSDRSAGLGSPAPLDPALEARMRALLGEEWWRRRHRAVQPLEPLRSELSLEELLSPLAPLDPALEARMRALRGEYSDLDSVGRRNGGQAVCSLRHRPATRF